MLEKVIEDILKEAFQDAKTLSSDNITETVSMLEDLLAGKPYENFLKADMNEPIVRNYIIANIGTCLLTMVKVPDEVLSKCSSNLKSRMLSYLDNIDTKFTGVLNAARDRIKKSITEAPKKKPEDMTREELLEYISSKWRDK